MLAGVWFLYYCFGLVIASIAPMVGPIANDLQLSLAEMGRILGAWQLVYLFSAIRIGIVIDRFGLRASLTAAALIIALSAFLRGVANDNFSLWLAVAIFGIGGPLISIGAPKIIARWFESDERGFAMGIYMTGPALGTITSLSLTNSVLLPWLNQNWRHVFFVFAIVAIGCAALWILINSTSASKRHNATQRNAGALNVFIQLLGIPLVIIVLIMSIGIFAINHGLGNWLPEILRDNGMSAIKAGYWAAIPTLFGIAGSLLIPRLATKTNRFYLLIALFCCALVAIVLIRTVDGPLLAGGLMIQGIARSSMMTIAILILMETPAVGADNMGVAGGLFFTAAEFGGVLGPVSIGIIADNTGGFNAALEMLAYICLGLIALAVIAKRMDAR